MQQNGKKRIVRFKDRSLSFSVHWDIDRSISLSPPFPFFFIDTAFLCVFFYGFSSRCFFRFVLFFFFICLYLVNEQDFDYANICTNKNTSRECVIVTFNSIVLFINMFSGKHVFQFTVVKPRQRVNSPPRSFHFNVR